MVRTLIGHLEDRYRKIEPTEPMMAWLIRHAGWLITRFRVHPSGKTSYFMVKLRNYSGEVLQIGEVCWARDPGPRRRPTQGRPPVAEEALAWEGGDQ